MVVTHDNYKWQQEQELEALKIALEEEWVLSFECCSKLGRLKGFCRQ
jgi:hypothetical protein